MTKAFVYQEPYKRNGLRLLCRDEDAGPGQRMMVAMTRHSL